MNSKSSIKTKIYIDLQTFSHTFLFFGSYNWPHKSAAAVSRRYLAFNALFSEILSFFSAQLEIRAN